MIEHVNFEGRNYAIIIRNEFREKGITFVTPDDYSQQLAFMQHDTGKRIKPHVHNHLQREVTTTQEVLWIKKGKLRVDFYTPSQSYLESRVLEAGDVILLAYGGHGFEVLDNVEMFEVKQGPYAGEADKTRFDTNVQACELSYE